ncbi:hypothetical protein MOE66_20020 [Bacillus atrophaeus]|uniref:hypothetical protein n=1 Tax=Bacillus atrophaeus TaxID=1452 RepID=UPI002280E0CB|nr:hypothetical protein [Bacillus atrophaeus]MCY9136868.1 hypothetical protein [Bacillus atrophaeus]
MITIVGRHFCVDIRGINVNNVSNEEFKNEIDGICTLIQKNSEDIKYYFEKLFRDSIKVVIHLGLIKDSNRRVK